MPMRTLFSAISTLFLSLTFTPIFPQVVLLDDSQQRQTGPIYRGLYTRTAGLDTLQISADSPFFDDFSQSNSIYPDTSLWFAKEAAFDAPTITQNTPIDPPTKGVMTFDGLQRIGTPYVTNGFSAGTADRLFSHHIDLSAYQSSDQVVLSFFLQPGGRADAPETVDSFKVLFRTNLPGDDEYRLVYSRGGSGNSEGFEFISIPVDAEEYFHPGFQVLFESEGGISGAFDHWHLDYVYLAPGRSQVDGSFEDASLTQLLSSPLAPYTAIPTQHYPASAAFMQPFELNSSNLNASTQAGLIDATITESVSGASFSSGDQTFISGSLVPYAQQAVIQPLNPFMDQNLNGEIAGYELEAVLSVNADNFSQNNTLRKTFRIDSILAYDDGEADTGFGLNQRLGFGMKVELEAPDSLTGVWINFVPAVYTNQVSGQATYMEDQTFRVIIWNAPNPDSIFAEQAGGMRVRYGETPNHFERYEFPAPVDVPATFWIGIQQTSSLPIWVGYDKNSDRDDLTFFDASGNWTNTSQDGALMIRPEFFRTATLPASIEAPEAAGPSFSLFPQPVKAGQLLNLRRPQYSLGFPYRGELLDLQGRRIASFELGPHEQTSFQLPTGLPAGIYLWRHNISSPKGPIGEVERVWILGE